ncbi:MAG TPA: DUF4424 domain-containing protein [Xanthobacteraceae bacterium]
MRYPTAFALAVAALAPAALANDTTAELATGGLIFVTTDEVEMRSEKLFISTEQVRVTYEFFNKSDKDVTTLVAFPLPEIRIATQDDNVAVPSEEPNNVFGFKTTVDGVPVKAEVEQRVTAMGVDRTQYLRALGIPLDPHLPATDQALDKLPQDKWPELVALGLAEIAEYDDTGKGMKKHLEARWGLATTYYWKQTFPAKKQIVIHHQYVPSVGGSAQTDLGAPNQATIPGYADYARKYCIDQAFMATIQNLRKVNKSEFGPPYSEQRIDYILKTGANWSGPIGNFELTVDKGSPDTLVSFCGTNVKKISATQFQMQQKDFSPEGDLAVLFLIKIQN